MHEFFEKTLPSLVGTFVGAILAFTSAAIQRWMERKTKRYEALMETQVVLISQRNSVLLHRTRLLEGLKAKGQLEGTNPFANLKKILLTFSRREIDFRQVGFLGASSDPQLLLELEVAEEFLQVLVRHLALRDEMIARYLESPKTEVTPMEGAENMVHTKGDPTSISDIKYMNEFVWFAMNQAIEKNGVALDRLYTLAMKLFGGRQFFVGPRKPFPYILKVNAPPPSDHES